MFNLLTDSKRVLYGIICFSHVLLMKAPLKISCTAETSLYILYIYLQKRNKADI